MIDECLGVEVGIDGGGCPLADAAAAAEVTIDARPPLRREDGNALLRFSGPESDELAAALDGDDRLHYLYQSHTDDRDTYRCLSTQRCVVHDLISAGFLVDAITYRPDRTAVTGAVVGQEVLQGVMETAGETVGVELERVYPLGPEDDAPVPSRWDLTPAQAESLRAALAMGYFTVPRQTTASDVAEAIGVSKTAFLERLRRAQATVFGQLFDVAAPSPHG